MEDDLCQCNAGLEVTSEKLLNHHCLPGPSVHGKFHCPLVQEMWLWPGLSTPEGKEGGKSDGKVPIDGK